MRLSTKKRKAMSRILVPLDGSELAEHVIPYVIKLAQLKGLEVQLLHVLSGLPYLGIELETGLFTKISDDTTVLGAPPTDHMLGARTEAEAYLNKQAARLRAEGLVVGTYIADGRPAQQIVEIGANAALIAMATHGYSGLRRWTLGSVTDESLRSTKTPIFVVRSEKNDWDMKRILVSLDGSDLARLALKPAFDIARQSGAEVHLFTVVPPSVGQFDPELRLDRAGSDKLRERLLQEPVDVGIDTSGITVKSHVMEGFVAEAITEEAQKLGVDLIVMASHGFGGWRRFSLGSVTDKVMHATSIPMFVIPHYSAD